MGFLGSLLGKNDTGIIIDVNGISADSVHITLRYLSELFKNNSIVCVTNSNELLDLKGRNIFWGSNMVQFTKRTFQEPPTNSPIKGVNLIDKDYFIQFVSKGIFDWVVKKPVIFTDDVSMVRSSLQWTPIEKPPAQLAVSYAFMFGEAYTNINKGISTSTNDLAHSFASFYIMIQKLQNFASQNLESPSSDIGDCLHYILIYKKF